MREVLVRCLFSSAHRDRVARRESSRTVDGPFVRGALAVAAWMATVSFVQLCLAVPVESRAMAWAGNAAMAPLSEVVAPYALFIAFAVFGAQCVAGRGGWLRVVSPCGAVLPCWAIGSKWVFVYFVASWSTFTDEEEWACVLDHAWREWPVSLPIGAAGTILLAYAFGRTRRAGRGPGLGG
jgi:hypothetical protein